jgi:hypothetical protein
MTKLEFLNEPVTLTSEVDFLFFKKNVNELHTSVEPVSVEISEVKKYSHLVGEESFYLVRSTVTKADGTKFTSFSVFSIEDDKIVSSKQITPLN